jgi:uncharacterized RmlC-like cupin family protein
MRTRCRRFSRAAAINRAWAELRNSELAQYIHANTKTSAHHYGHLESIIYVLKGKARIHWGEKF